MKQKVFIGSCFLVFGVFALLVHESFVYAQPTTGSSNYSLEEVFVGPGGTRDTSSTNYRAQGSLGDIAIGESASGGYNFLGGYTTDAEPSILFAVTGANIDLGLLSASTAATGNSTFSVGTYNAEGYVVQTVSDPPKTASHTLQAMTTTGVSSPGTEQFGINLVANTAPTTFGADPVQVPDATFSSGSVDSNYSTQNQFRYVVGETVASSTQSTGQTDFTISYLLNIEPLTPAGEYVMNHVLVATSTF